MVFLAFLIVLESKYVKVLSMSPFHVGVDFFCLVRPLHLLGKVAQTAETALGAKAQDLQAARHLGVTKCQFEIQPLITTNRPRTQRLPFLHPDRAEPQPGTAV